MVSKLLRQGMQVVEACTPAFKCCSLEVTPVTSTHDPLARTRYLSAGGSDTQGGAGDNAIGTEE